MIKAIFPDSEVATKTFFPEWSGAGPRYLVVNYEMFQQPKSATAIRSLCNGQPIDLIVIDEIHHTKQRQAENMSRRRQMVAALVTTAAESNPNIHVLGLSATPVINNLQEGKSLIELITGAQRDDLETRATIANCMRLHQDLVTSGIRYMPPYAEHIDYAENRVAVDCSPWLDEIRALGAEKGSPLALEQILTEARLPAIREHIVPKTLVYTHYVGGIVERLRNELRTDGWSVGEYTGEEKNGLDRFIHGDLDVLIGSSSVATGVDGLQQVCSHMVINVLPWTNAEFEQLKGRIWRQGQREQAVQVVIPTTFADVEGQRWSWCESKLKRLHWKKSIADAALDGIVPEGHLRTEAQAYKDAMAWLERLEAGEVTPIERPRLAISLPPDDGQTKPRLARYGDFSLLNSRWNRSHSSITHQRLNDDAQEWEHYHALYRQARASWPIVPYEYMIEWCRERSGYVIGDFGCGEALLAEAVSDRHTVFSFDHVAINDSVLACDMAHTGLDNEVLDVAIFSLSLMGANFTDYLREAHRCLKLDGQLHIVEASSRFTNPAKFVEGLEQLGFRVALPKDIAARFTHVQAWKSSSIGDPGVELDL